MFLLYNIHTPSKTFAIQHKDGEQYSDLISRLASKAGLNKQEVESLREGKDGSGLVYEYEGSRWSLEDDDDLSIFLSRFPPSSTSSATFHLNPPHAHAHFDLPDSPAKSRSQPPSAASALKDKTKSPVKKSSKAKSETSGDSGVKMKDYASGKADAAGTEGRELGAVAPTKASGTSGANGSSVANGSSGANVSNGTAGKTDRKVSNTSGGAHNIARAERVMFGDREADDGRKPETAKGWTNPKHAHFAASIHSTKSHRSKWGDDDAEPLWEVKKREWLEFHNGNGVRTVMGSVGGAKNVRMLLIPGHRGVYVSRPFALKHNLVPKQFAMGAAGYTGLKSIGLVPITVAGKTEKHNVLINEEEHFDVVLGRSWVEKMNIKVDPIDQTILTYMKDGSSIPCDIVVLKDKDGNKITIT